MVGSGGLGGLGTALYFMKKEGDRIAAQSARRRQLQLRKARRNDPADRLRRVEADLGKILLRALAVNRLLIAKRVISPQEIVRLARQRGLPSSVASPPAAARRKEVRP